MEANCTPSPLIEINLFSSPVSHSRGSPYARLQPRTSEALNMTTDTSTRSPQPRNCYERSMSSDIGYWDRPQRRSPGSAIWAPRARPPVPLPPLPPAPPLPPRAFTAPLFALPYGTPPRRGSYDSTPTPGGRPAAPHPPPPASYVAFEQNVLSHRRWRSHDGYVDRKESKKLKKSREWPPRGYDTASILSPQDAKQLIPHGASSFKGLIEEALHAPGNYRFFAIMTTESNLRSDRAPFGDESFAAVTLPMTGPADSKFPWYSLEQPCMGYAFGRSPGTTTLTYYVGMFGSLKFPTEYGSRARPRKMKLIAILERLSDLEMGLHDEHPEETYHYLYDTLIDDPDRFTEPHFDRALQIADLITVLSNPDWIDFSQPRNQVVAKFFDHHDERVKHRFFHQLLLASELHLRIQSAEHMDKAKRELLSKLPPKVSWDLALAERWLENMAISRSEMSALQSTFTFELRSKRRQKAALLAFAARLKWPNMQEVEATVSRERSGETALEDRSADTMSWFTGVILPGPTLPFLLMNSLIDCDRDAQPGLQYLSHVHPSAGFQYRANTYWSAQSILGKVLGAGRGVRAVAGWIGPCIYTPDLGRTQCILVRQAEPPTRRHLSRRDLDTMAARSAPLGPSSAAHDTPVAVADFEEWLPIVRRGGSVSGDDDDAASLRSTGASSFADVLRIEKLSFRAAPPPNQAANPLYNVATGRGALLYDTGIVFAVGAGKSRQLALRFNVAFVAAFACTAGPHPLHRAFRFSVARVADRIAGPDVARWWDRNAGRVRDRERERDRARDARSRSMPVSPVRRGPPPRSFSASASVVSGFVAGGSGEWDDGGDWDDDDSGGEERPAAFRGLEDVLVVEACGVSDNEVYARAWCANFGFDALVANANDTCVACAVREAYAACLSVVILTEGGRASETESVVGGAEDDDDDDDVVGDGVSLGYLYGKV